MPYQIIEHMADFKISVSGKTPEYLFSEAMAAMMFVLKNNPPKSADWRIRRIKINSPDLSALLVDFLSEVLSLAQINKEIYTLPANGYGKVNFKKFSQNYLEAELEGIGVDSFDEDIKAVTYHEADVKRDKDGFWKTNLVFDI